MVAEFEFAGERLVLLPERAIWWPTQAALLVSDVHLGKSATFRKLGLAIPERECERDLLRLSQLIATYQPRHLYFLGDLIHHTSGLTTVIREQLVAWRSRHAAQQVTLILGNHDTRGVTWLAELGLNPISIHNIGPIQLEHLPQPQPQQPRIVGHLHPMIRLPTYGRTSERLPCFWRQPQQLVLPAFGSLIDGAIIRPAVDDRVFAVTPTSVCEIPIAAMARG